MDRTVESKFLNSHCIFEIINEYKYEGLMTTVLKNLLKFDFNNICDTDEPYIMTKTSILLRTAINYNITTNTAESHRLILKVTNLCIKIFSQIAFSDQDSDEIITELKLLENYPDFSDQYIRIDRDSISCIALEENHTYNSLIKLDEISSGRNVCLVAIAGGAIISGLYIFALAKHFGIIGQNSIFFPVRFSRRKSKDSSPKLNSFDIDYLTFYSGNHELVIYEDDASSGDTVFYMGRELINRLHKNIHIVCGVPTREESNPYGMLFLEKLVNTPLELPHGSWSRMTFQETQERKIIKPENIDFNSINS